MENCKYSKKTWTDFLTLLRGRLKLQGLINDPEVYQKEKVNVKEKQPFQKKEDLSFLKQKTETIGKERVISKVNMAVYPDNISEVDEQIDQNIEKNLDGTFSCKFCGKSSGRNIGHCKNHVETHLEGLSFNCPICEKNFRSRPSLAMHKHRNH